MHRSFEKSLNQTLLLRQWERQSRFLGAVGSSLFALLCAGLVRSLHPPLLPDHTQEQQDPEGEQRQGRGRQGGQGRRDQLRRHAS